MRILAELIGYAAMAVAAAYLLRWLWRRVAEGIRDRQTGRELAQREQALREFGGRLLDNADCFAAHPEAAAMLRLIGGGLHHHGYFDCVAALRRLERFAALPKIDPSFLPPSDRP